jgi:hypothetical protein
MNNQYTERIAIALEKIAILMENAQRREINITKKAQVAESNALKKKLIDSLKESKRNDIKDSKSKK